MPFVTAGILTLLQTLSTNEIESHVGEDGLVYEKDLGKNTEDVAKNLKEFNPTTGWKKNRLRTGKSCYTAENELNPIPGKRPLGCIRSYALLPPSLFPFAFFFSLAFALKPAGIRLSR